MILSQQDIPSKVGPPLVCIDPGHPSETSRGTRGRRSTEIQVAWKLAVDLEKSLASHKIRVVLTKKSENQQVSNRRRAETANHANATLTIRLHCDAGSGTGFAVYYPDHTGRIHGFTGPSFQVMAKSKVAANTFHAVMRKELGGFLKDNGLQSDLKTAVGSHQGALTGSIFSKVPVLLVEMVVLQNPKDEAFILSKSGERQMCTALTDATLAALKVTNSLK